MLLETNPTPTLEERLAAIDAAYPFGERAHYPYKMWLLERRAWIDANSPALEGAVSRPCAACGVKRGEPCREMLNPRYAGDDLAWPIGTPRPMLPAGEYHEVRTNPPSGPLFG